MKTYKHQIILILTLILASCQDELELNNIENNQPEAVIEKTIENGRFVFSSKESLKTTIEDFQNDEIENVEKEFEKLYEKGFRSHKPIVNPENEQLQAKFSEEIMLKRQMRKSSSSTFSKTSNSEEEEEEEFIADPLLASLVNENNEIIVNDTLYKFTKEKGLFFTHVKDSTYLFNFFKEDSNNTNKAASKTARAIPIDLCEERRMYGGFTRVDKRISRYLRPIENDCYGGGGGSGGGGNTNPVPQLSEEERLNNIINSLPVCDGNARGNWVQNLFGKSYVCRNYFSSKHRIKTEFWDQSWGIYKSVGILTKTQRKRFWIWWASKSDEIHLGINHIMLRYNFPQPQISSYSHPQLFPLNSYKNPIYLWDGNFNVNVSNSNFGTFVNTQLNLPSGKLPFFDFGNEQILNIYIPKVYKKGKYNLNLTTQDITSQSNIKALYKMGIDFLNSPQVANSGASKKTFAVTYQKDYNNIEVIYFSERYSKRNENYLKRRFYSDVGFVIGWAWNDNPKPIKAPDGTVIGTDYSGTGKFNVEVADDYFRDYTHYELDFYGMARRGSTWRGNRMIR